MSAQNKSQTPNPNALRTDVQKRLAAVADKHSQADISRKTGISPNNVSRYMRGGKVPIEFGGALVAGLGVNPAWLLAGEGAPYLSDVPGETSEMASDMLQVVQAMNAVMKMKLGSLVGKEQVLVLRRMDEAITEYEKLREKLDAQMRPVIGQMLDNGGKAYSAGKIAQAEDFARAASQLMRFCEDAGLEQTLLGLELRIESRRSHFDRVLELQRKRFNNLMSSEKPESDAFMRVAQELIASLGNVGYRAEAKRYCRAALALAEQARASARYWTLVHWEGELDAFLGDIGAGLPKLLEAYNHFDTELARNAKHKHLFWLLVQGALRVEEAVERIARADEMPDPIRAAESLAYISTFACWAEDAGGLARVNKLWESRAVEELKVSEDVGFVLVRLLLKSLGGARKGVAKEFMESAGARAMFGSAIPVYKLAGHIYACQLARRENPKEAAMELLEQADSLLTAIPGEVTVDILDRATHYRNALDLIPADARSERRIELRKRAQAFFSEHYARGYGCFKRNAE